LDDDVVLEKVVAEPTEFYDADTSPDRSSTAVPVPKLKDLIVKKVSAKRQAPAKTAGGAPKKKARN
jgi:hypothetical protein